MSACAGKMWVTRSEIGVSAHRQPRLGGDRMTRTRVPGPKPVPAIERIRQRGRREDRGYTSPCLVYAGTLMRGYGYINTGSVIDGTARMVFVHKVVWEHENGPVSEGLELDHICKQKDCHEVTHLEPVTHQENVRRGRAGEVNGARMRAMTHCKRDHPLSGENVYHHAGKRHCKTCRGDRQRAARALRAS